MVNQNISAGKFVFFILTLIAMIFIYYKKILQSEGDEIKGLKMMKQIFGLLIIIGLINTISNTPEMSGKFLILLILTIMLNIYNINYSLKKCKYPSLYKINLFARSSILLIVFASIIYYSLDNDILSFLYTDIDSSSSTITDIFDSIKVGGSSIPDYCPNMNSDDYKDELTKEGIKWQKLTSDERNKCSSSNSELTERKDITNNIYA